MGVREAAEEDATMFALAERIVLLAVVALILYVAFTAVTGASRRAVTGSGQRAREVTAGANWQAAHYGEAAMTRIVVRKVVPGTGMVLDEHLIDSIRDDDPDWDARFLDAMARARARAALLQSEE
jgi:hypothetical protein